MRWLAAVAICLVVAGHARAEDWGVKRDPFDAGVVRRYKALLERDPHDAGALRALVAMYQRYRTVARLEAEYREQRESWATLVVLARLPRASRTDTTALWNRALKLKADDARGWIAVGDLALDAASARTAYQAAVKHASSPRERRLALTKLLGAARSAGDPATVDATYVELIALSPKDGMLWLDRGSAQLAAGRLAPAAESFASAEALLARDPERRLTAMTNQGIVLERLGRVDDAIAQYVRTLDRAPKGYYLGSEIVSRIVEAERKRKRLPAAIARFEQRWPERSRGHFEWSTLADLYRETGNDAQAVAAYKRALRRAPTELETQRKLIALLDRVKPEEALAQHEAAARLAPGDANIQIELAKRYEKTDRAKAVATLDRLSRRLSRNVNVRRALGELFTQWEVNDRALREYTAVADLEPTDEDHAITLGEMYWRLGQLDEARTAWQRLAKINTASALYRQGETFAMHDLWSDAVGAYTRSLELDRTKADTWRGRARAYDELGRHAEAVADARRAVALVGAATYDSGDRERRLLARALGHWYSSAAGPQLPELLARWRFAFERGDVAAGYMLVEHHARIGSPQRHDVLVALYKRVPTDDALGVAVARSYGKRNEFDHARAELERIAKRTPTRAEEMAVLVGQLERDRIRAEEEARWDEEGISTYERSRRRAAGRPPDLVGATRKLGVRFGIGTDVQGGENALLGVGLYRSHRVADGTAIPVRFEWVQRDDEMDEINAFAGSIGITRRLLDLRRFEIAAGVAPRLEIRYGSEAAMSSLDRTALAADLHLELLPRALPATLGMRFSQSLTDPGRPSTLAVELGFEWR